MRIIQETQQFNPVEVKVLVETQEEYNNFLEYVKNYETKVVSSGKQPDPEGWISNIENKTYPWPSGYDINPDTPIEVEKRNGIRLFGAAGAWLVSWNGTRNHVNDIVRFRIVKD